MGQVRGQSADASMVRRSLAATVVAVVVAVLPTGGTPQLLAATADAHAKTFPFAFPLPPPGHGAIYELKLRVPMPVGTSFRGGFGMASPNGFPLEGRLDAAGMVFFFASGPPVEFVALHARHLAVSARDTRDLSLNVVATVVGPYASVATVSRGSADACGELRRLVTLTTTHTAASSYYNLTSRFGADSPSIVTSTEKADPHCK